MADIQTTHRGRGRPKGSGVAHWMANRGHDPVYAAEVLATCTSERRTWKRLLSSEDDRVVLQAMQFLVQMRDGKPSQSISVTSTNINLNARDIETARAIVREIRGDSHALPGTVNAHGEAIALSEGEGMAQGEAEAKAKTGRNMLLANEGGRKDG